MKYGWAGVRYDVYDVKLLLDQHSLMKWCLVKLGRSLSLLGANIEQRSMTRTQRKHRFSSRGEGSLGSEGGQA